MKRLPIAVLLFAACSAPEAPTATAPAPKPAPPALTALQARDVIANSSDFGEYEFTNAAASIPLQRSAMRGDQRAIADALQAAGWVRLDAGELALTSKAKSDKRFLLRPNGTLDVVPLAKKELVSVGAVRPLPDGKVAADVTWRWIVNDVGAAFTAGPLHDRYALPQKASVTLFFDGTAWSVLRIAKS